ncbi:MAG: TetR/AcrR family transcriptional regulator [Candidatus Aminicenantales bacterium]
MKKRNLRLERERLRREKNKRYILKAAEKVFIQKGFGRARMDEIAREAQFSKATLYRYFRSKSEMFAEIIFNAFEDSYQRIRMIREKPDPAEKRLLDLIRFVLLFYRKKQNLTRIVYFEKSALKDILKTELRIQNRGKPCHPRIPDRFMTIIKQSAALVAEILQDGVESGEFRKMDVSQASMVLGALLRGFQFRGPLEERHEPVAKTAELIHDFFLRGIRKPGKV